MAELASRISFMRAIQAEHSHDQGGFSSFRVNMGFMHFVFTIVETPNLFWCNQQITLIIPLRWHKKYMSLQRYRFLGSCLLWQYIKFCNLQRREIWSWLTE
ncbi:hypothetical protein LINPERPRIM_LOCUS15365 [Linum perenne]